jgi:hypothetical protein
MNNDQHVQVISKIISAQSEVIGPLAYDLAHNVGGLVFDGRDVLASVNGDYKNVLTDLVKQYSKVFGQSSIEVCKDVVSQMDPPLDKGILPDELMSA